MTEAREQIDLAKDVQDTVKAAEPSLEDADQLNEQLEKEMLTTISEMKEATRRVGPFGAQVGNGDQSAFILRQPLVEQKVRYEGGKEIEHHTYIVATTKGFRGLEIVSDKSLPKQFQDEQVLVKALESAKDGMVESKGRGIPGYWHHPDVQEVVSIPVVGEDRCKSLGAIGGEILVPATPDQVTEALENSIAKAQAPHKTAISSAKVDLGTATNARSKL